MNNFNSKETYLSATSEWKANYAMLSTAIRKARAEYNEAQSKFSKTGNYSYSRGSDNTAWNAAYKVLDAARNERETLRREAREAIAERWEMKAEAARQWAASTATA